MKNAVTKHAELRNRFIAMLTESRGGPTDEESAMLDAFLMTESHLTIEAFLLQNDGLFPGINRMQVRRFFALLIDYGIARSQLIGGKERFEHLHLDEHHDHLICVKCGAIETFHDDEIEVRQVKAAVARGFTPLMHCLEIRGLCSNCRELLPKTVRLNNVLPGELVSVQRVVGGRGVCARLSAMGITRGVELKVLHAHGRFLVLVRNSRLALGRRMAARIEVLRVDRLSADGEEPEGADTEQKAEGSRCLLDLETGAEAKIEKICGRGAIRQRMLDMGITRGTSLKVERYAPMGDPVEIRIKGYLLAIRKEEARHILVS